MKRKYIAPETEVVEVCGNARVLADPSPYYPSVHGKNENGTEEYYQDHMDIDEGDGDFAKRNQWGWNTGFDD